MRLRGRLQESEFSFDVKHPIILPKSSAIVDLIIWECHNLTHHGGVNITLREVRKKYWIIQGRQTVKKVIGRCVLCKKLKGKPGSEPFAPLPRERIVAANPFQTTGTDFAGPLYVKDNDGSKKKMYIMIFTCAATRALHLELLRDMSTESCINGLRRFIARRGAQKIIYSDNAKSFKRTSMELDELFQRLKESKFQEVATCSRIRWRFIADRASWWGGWWERLIKNVKNSLKITLGKASLDEENLITVLTEVEATVNSRPLTYISEQPDEYFILSPAHFLLPGTVHQTGLVFEGNCVSRGDLI